jgi:hypothetical protein
MAEPREILDTAFQKAINPHTVEASILERVQIIVFNTQNRAAVRLVLACALAKVHQPKVDIRKPYTEIGDADAFSGRVYDERDLASFLMRHHLPVNETTAFLTPALRNRNQTLEKNLNLVGKPPIVYQAALNLLDDVHSNKISASDLLSIIFAELVALRNNNQQRLQLLLHISKETNLPLSSEEIWVLLEQHLRSPRSSRLPVLMITAVYQAIGHFFNEQPRPLEAHNAADRQTKSLGDIEIIVTNDQAIVTGFEVKTKRITRNDLEIVLHKIAQHPTLQNYVFISTESIDQTLLEYAATLYEQNGIEMTILDCMGFMRYFLHFFHRHRIKFLETYQVLLLQQPDSAVGQPLKETWLALRRAAEAR